jgi:LysM repeat protein
MRGNKYAVAAVGVGASVGAVVWWRRHQAGTTGGAAGGSSSSSGGYIANPANADTTGTDVANWVGQALGQYSDSLAAYEKSLTDEVAQLKQLIGQQPGPTPAPTPAPIPTPGTGTPVPGRRSVIVTPYPKGTYRPVNNWASTLSGIASHEKTTVPKLLALNPSVKNPNLIYAGQKIYTS